VNELATATAVLERGLRDRTYSAVSAEVGNVTGPLWKFAAGFLAADEVHQADEATIFDLASLTKVLATTAIALRLVGRGDLRLDDPVSAVLHSWNVAGRDRVTIRDLLEHCSGLPAYRDYFQRLTGVDAYLAAIADEPLEYEPRTRAIYSDLGFITLGGVLERIAGAPLDQQFATWMEQSGIQEPLAYVPPSEWRSRTAVTEYDSWRGRLLQGDVHDQNAAALGGVAPHAGLFGTAGAVGAAARWWLRQLKHELGQRFARRSSVPDSSRALGWDTMLPTSSCGQRLSPTAIGHTGFTGTTLWIDPTRGLYFVLLTNRVHLSRSSDAIQQVRREFHNAAMEALT
jgi:CubicO group peptidase (beta-lactamase class C family)